MSTIIHLVRHGRIPNYETDQSLTAEGREEALAVGQGLATLIRPGESVRFFSSPARRARETAALLRDGLRQAMAPETATVVGTVEVDDRLQNNQFYVNGASYDLMMPLLDIVRWRQHEQPSPQNEALVMYQASFWTAPDPVAYWLSQPHASMESPGAVVERVQAFLAERLTNASDETGLHRDICITHSANLRAILRQVFGRDPGPPPFSGMLTIREGQVEYQNQVGDWSLYAPGDGGIA